MLQRLNLITWKIHILIISMLANIFLSILTKPEYQDLFTKGERRYSYSRGVIPPRPVKTPSNAWEFMSIEQARNLADSFKEDSDLEIAWKYEKEIDIDALKLRYKIPLMVNDISIKP
jgi:hypothetical protein